MIKYKAIYTIKGTDIVDRNKFYDDGYLDTTFRCYANDGETILTELANVAFQYGKRLISILVYSDTDNLLAY